MTSGAIRIAEGEDIRGASEGLRAQALLPPGPALPAGTKGRKIVSCFVGVGGGVIEGVLGECDRLVRRCFATSSC